MRVSYDVIVIGLGAMGSATACHLARRNQAVLGLDRYTPPHTLGSSHGASRVIRSAYYEDPSYVPLARRALELWRELEAQSGETLFKEVGCLNIGPVDGSLVGGARASAEAHSIRHEMLDSDELRRRFPAFNPDRETVALWEPEAGALFPERCITAHLARAGAEGAELRFDEMVDEWEVDGEGVRVRTAKGEYRAAQLVISAGAWAGRMLEGLGLPLEVERQVVYWFEARERPEVFRAERCPVYMWEHEAGRYVYGLPDFGEGAKFGRHHEGAIVDPDRVERAVTEEEIEEIVRMAKQMLPGLAERPRAHSVCLYTNTPDHHFLIDRHPLHPQVLIASPCSGHGFKFASAIGESLAAWIVDGDPQADLSLFRIGRLLG